MHTPDTLHALDPDRYNALVDAAKARARTLRREAVGAFWDDLGHYWRFCSHRIDSGLGFLGLAEHPVDRRAGGGQADDRSPVLGRASSQGPRARMLHSAHGLGHASGQAVKGLACFGDVGQGLLGGAQDGALLGQPNFLALMRIQPVELGEPQSQLFGFLGGSCDGRTQLIGASAGGLPGAPTSGDRAVQTAERAIGVQQRPMSASIQQADRLVLAMHLQQHFAQFAQHGGAGRLIIDEGAAAAVSRKRAAQDQILVARVGNALLFQDIPDGVLRRRRENGRHRRLARTLADQAGLGARARGEAQGVEDDRLPRPCLARQRRKARTNGKVQRLDQHHVADP